MYVERKNVRQLRQPERIFPSLNKWIDPTRPDRQKEQGQRDFIWCVLGETYLLRAGGPA